MDVLTLFQSNTFLLLTIIWTMPWKGFALWKAAQNKHKWWFVAILLTNTFALLDALYIFYFSKRKSRKGDKKSAVKKSAKSATSASRHGPTSGGKAKIKKKKNK